MAANLSRIFGAGVLLAIALSARAGNLDIDLNSPGGVAGTGGFSEFTGPCYCSSSEYFSPVYLVQAGETGNFGQVTLYSWQSGTTPDGGPDQPYLFVFPSPTVSFNAPPLPLLLELGNPGAPSANVTFGLCDQSDIACISSSTNAPSSLISYTKFSRVIRSISSPAFRRDIAPFNSRGQQMPTRTSRRFPNRRT